MSDCILKRYTGYKWKGRATSVIVPLSDLKVTKEVFSLWVEIPREETLDKLITPKGGVDE